MRANIQQEWPVDINGKKLKDGDIVAECQIGRKIWEDKGVITSRPIGIFHVLKNPKNYKEFVPERTDFYNITLLRTGTVEMLDKASNKEFFDESDPSVHRTVELYLSSYDGAFYGWDDIEIIGNIYDDFS